MATADRRHRRVRHGRAGDDGGWSPEPPLGSSPDRHQAPWQASTRSARMRNACIFEEAIVSSDDRRGMKGGRTRPARCARGLRLKESPVARWPLCAATGQLTVRAGTDARVRAAFADLASAWPPATPIRPAARTLRPPPTGAFVGSLPSARRRRVLLWVRLRSLRACPHSCLRLGSCGCLAVAARSPSST